MLKLSQVNIGVKYIIKEINDKSSLKIRLRDMGFVNGSEVTCMFKSIFNNPGAYKIKGTLVALRNDEAENIIVMNYGENL